MQVSGEIKHRTDKRGHCPARAMTIHTSRRFNPLIAHFRTLSLPPLFRRCRGLSFPHDRGIPQDSIYQHDSFKPVLLHSSHHVRYDFALLPFTTRSSPAPARRSLLHLLSSLEVIGRLCNARHFRHATSCSIQSSLHDLPSYPLQFLPRLFRACLILRDNGSCVQIEQFLFLKEQIIAISTDELHADLRIE
jgi:hypothetical protein